MIQAKLKYRIYTQHTTNDKYKTKYWTPRDEYDNHKSAEKKANKSYKKYPFKIVKIPKKFKVGFKIFGDGEKLSGSKIPDSRIFHYGTIVSESDTFWFVERTFVDDSKEPIFFLKSDMEDKYVEEKFIIPEEE